MESVFTRKGNVGSNPTLSAMQYSACFQGNLQVLLEPYYFPLTVSIGIVPRVVQANDQD